MLLVPSFRPPPCTLASPRVSEHDRLGTLLSMLDHKTGKLGNFFSDSISPPLSPTIDRVSPAHRSSEQQETPFSNHTSSSSSGATQSLNLFGGELTWSRGQTARPGPPPEQPVPQPVPNTSMISAPTTALRFASIAEPSARPLGRSFESLLRKLDNSDNPPPPPPKKAKANPPPLSAPIGASFREPRAAANSSRTRAIVPASLATIVAEDFTGIESVCRNAGGTSAGLRTCLDEITSASCVAMAYLYTDLTSSHAPVTVKYCKPSTACTVWHCPCDKNIRSQYLTKKLLGAVICIRGPDPATPSALIAANYFLPLAPCNETTQSSQDTDLAWFTVGKPVPMRFVFTLGVNRTSRQVLPIKCQTSLQQRALSLVTILTSPVTKVIFHAQVACMSSHELCRTMGCHPVDVFDPRLGRYLQDPDVDDAGLELTALVDDLQLAALDAHRLGRLSHAIAKCSAELRALLALQTSMQAHLVEAGLWTLFRSVEMPLACILAGMEVEGVLVDTDSMHALGARLEQQLVQVDGRAQEAAGSAFSASSPEQVSKLLFETLRLQPPNAEDDGRRRHFSTSEEELQRLRSAHPVVPLILQHRALSKLLSTYIYGVKPLLVPQLQKEPRASLHATWNQTSVRTGRLSCSQPNLQNIPNTQRIDGVEYDVRSLFAARQGRVYVGADYSQIEMRVLAHLCQDPALCALFRQEGDIYSLLAGKIFHKQASAVLADERDKAKVICLGVLYGMGAAATAAKLSVDVPSANRIIQSFFSNFSQVRQWIQRVKSQARSLKQIKTLLGRVRHLPLIASDDSSKAATAERQAVNSVIQGTASDLIKLAMVLCTQHISQGADAWELAQAPRLVMQIHDELIFEVPEGEATVAAFVATLRDVMERQVVEALQLSVPLIANISVGRRWGSMTALPG